MKPLNRARIVARVSVVAARFAAPGCDSPKQRADEFGKRA